MAFTALTTAEIAAGKANKQELWEKVKNDLDDLDSRVTDIESFPVVTLPDGKISIGNSSNEPVARTITGDISISNTGVAAYVGTLPVAKGGTGIASPGASGNILVSNGTAWVSGSSNAYPAIYQTTAGQAISENTTTIVNFGTSVYDPTSKVTTGGSWVYTATVAGVYQVSAVVTLPSGSWLTNKPWSMWVYKSGSLYALLDIQDFEANQTITFALSGSHLVEMSVSSTIDIRVFCNQWSGGGTRALSTTAGNCRVSISRIGA